MSNQQKRKVVVSTQETTNKAVQPANEHNDHQDNHHSDEEDQGIKSMENRKQASRIATQQLLNPNRHRKEDDKKQHKQTETKHDNQQSIKPPKKLMMYHRHKKDFQEEVKDIDMKPSEPKGLDIEDNSNKMPYRFNN